MVVGGDFNTRLIYKKLWILQATRHYLENATNSTTGTGVVLNGSEKAIGLPAG